MGPPRRIEVPPLTLRLWTLADLDEMDRAITESIEHLRPWLPWAANEPIGRSARAELIVTFLAQWETGEQYPYALFVGDEAVGGSGLHTRVGPGGFEIGYWVHPAWTGRGLATLACRAQTDAAFDLPDIDRVEIHHDKANVASRRVPEKLGYSLVAEVDYTVDAPGECGIECQWRITRDTWREMQQRP